MKIKALIFHWLPSIIILISIAVLLFTPYRISSIGIAIFGIALGLIFEIKETNKKISNIVIDVLIIALYVFLFFREY